MQECFLLANLLLTGIMGIWSILIYNQVNIFGLIWKFHCEENKISFH